MTSNHDRRRGAYGLKTISEQLRVLEHDLNRVSEAAGAHFTPGNRLPTSLGRPIGVMSSVEFPSDAVFSISANARTIDPAVRASRGTRFGRTAAVAGASFALVAMTAIIPPLLLRHPGHKIAPQAPAEKESSALRTEGFANAAQGLNGAAMPDQAPLPYTAHFVPAAGQGEAALGTDAELARAKRSGRSPEISGWMREAPATDQPPPWAPFGQRYSQ